MPITTLCPFCKSQIISSASRCPHCTAQLPPFDYTEYKRTQAEGTTQMLRLAMWIIGIALAVRAIAFCVMGR